MPNVIFCHPIANCYHRKIDVEESSATALGTSTEPKAIVTDSKKNVPEVVVPEQYCSSYFIGLTFRNGLRSVDLTTTIQVFFDVLICTMPMLDTC